MTWPSARAQLHIPWRRSSARPQRASSGSGCPSAATRSASYLAATTDASGNPRSRRSASLGSFFFLDRSLDGSWMHVQAEFELNQDCQVARSHRFAPHEVLLDERHHLFAQLVPPVRSSLLEHQPSNASRVEAELGLVVGGPRDAVLLGGIR